MKISNIIPYFKEELDGIADPREITVWACLVIQYLLGLNRAETIVYSNKVISMKNSDQIKQIINELKENKPIQYILGETEFYGLKYKVNKHTLIPRPETEELVDWILKEDFNSILDIGTGSGCIAISLAKHSSAQIVAIDNCEKALEVAKENAKLNKVDIKFYTQDIFQSTDLFSLDVIVSNPPYILESEKQNMKANVLQYEPHLALFISDKDPLVFYKKLVV